VQLFLAQVAVSILFSIQEHHARFVKVVVLSCTYEATLLAVALLCSQKADFIWK